MPLTMPDALHLLPSPWPSLLGLSLAYLLLFAACEWLHHRCAWPAEHTRKVAHVGAGWLALTFPGLLPDWRWVALLCVAFLGLLFLTKKCGLLRSVHGITRVSYGSALFPVVIAGCFWAYEQAHNPLYFYLPVMVLAMADPVACLVGKRLPIRRLWRHKTLGGSLAFGVVAAGLSGGLLLHFEGSVGWWPLLLRVGALAVVTTGAEALAGRGLDNLTIPLSALAVLALTE